MNGMKTLQLCGLRINSIRLWSEIKSGASIDIIVDFLVQ